MSACLIENHWTLQRARRHSTESCGPLQAGYAVAGTETRTTYVVHNQAGETEVISGEVLRIRLSLPVHSRHIWLVYRHAELGQTHCTSRTVFRLSRASTACLNDTRGQTAFRHDVWRWLAGLKDFQVLKTTQSGYSGFLHDKYTVLKDTSERIVATSITATWKCARASSSLSPPPLSPSHTLGTQVHARLMPCLRVLLLLLLSSCIG